METGGRASAGGAGSTPPEVEHGVALGGTPAAPTHAAEEVVPSPGWQGGRRRRRHPLLIALMLFVLLTIAALLYAVYSYRAFANAIDSAHDRLPAAVTAQLTPGDAMGEPQITLVVFQRSAAQAGQPELFSSVLIRTDPDASRNSLLAVPIELVLPTGGAPLDARRIYARSGLSGLLRGIERDLGVAVSHVVQINVDGIGALIDRVGGVTLTNPVEVRGSAEHAAFPRGELHLNGASAVDFLTVHRPLNLQAGVQLAVVGSFAHRLLRASSLLHLPALGRAIAEPLATDLSPSDMLRLGWVGYRSSGTTQCYLGGTPARLNSHRVVTGTEQNPRVIRMFLGEVPPQASSAPLAGGAGCGTPRPVRTPPVEISNCGDRAGGACPPPPVTVISDTTPLIAWVPYPGADRYAVRIGKSRTVYPLAARYQVTKPLPVGKSTTVYVYAYTHDRPEGFAIGIASLRPTRVR